MKNLLSLTFFLSLSFSLAQQAEEVQDSRPEKPNVILILTDDLGWQDVVCYDIGKKTPMETPNIDKLARKGVQFWQGYSPAPTCAPTRCSILSGLHPARLQKTHVVGGAPPAPYRSSWQMMNPWYSGRLPISHYIIPEALNDAGYVTGQCGKWHVAIHHFSYPQPDDHGFGWHKNNLGTTRKMQPDRLSDFATAEEGDPYKLDENGFTTHQNSLDALEFISTHKEKPFFLYYNTWLVHTPIHTRSEALYKKYCEKLGVEAEEDPEKWSKKGQTNPFYCAMVEELDYYMGQLFTYLEETDDPRWEGHKLIENTYIIFTSDNGGMEREPGQIITDNYPLDRGKISLMEGGTRVPLIITGPEIPAGVQSQVMVNGLDFYPTILSWTGAKTQKGQKLDGSNLAKLLSSDPTDASLVKGRDGKTRNSMMWHFPNSVALESTLRVGGYKLIKNYNHLVGDYEKEYELYQLYDEENKRVDIEEAKNLAPHMPEKVKEMWAQLKEELEEMDASYPYYNPHYEKELPHKEKVPTVGEVTAEEKTVSLSFTENGAKVKRVDFLYTLNAGKSDEEWFRKQATITAGKAAKEGEDPVPSTAKVEIPEGATHYFFNLIDENQFLLSHPFIDDVGTRGKKLPSTYALALPVAPSEEAPAEGEKGDEK